jgi:hypothetical protein
MNNNKNVITSISYFQLSHGSLYYYTETLSVVVCKSDVGFSVVVSINVVVTTLSVDISIGVVSILVVCIVCSIVVFAV